MKGLIEKIAFFVFLFCRKQTADEYFIEIQRHQERINRANNRRKKRLIKQQIKLENHE